MGAINHIGTNPNHYETDLSEYANAANKGALVNKLDFVVLAALEIDTKFNVNVLTGSDGILRGEPDKLEWEDKVVAVLEARDGTILYVIRKIKPLELD